MISEAELAKKIGAWQKSPEGKRRTKDYLDGLAARGSKTVSGQVVVGPQQMEEAAQLFIQILQSLLPESIADVGKTLHSTAAKKIAPSTYEVAVRFDQRSLHRDSLDNDLGYDGIDNIVALFNNGYHAKNYVYGWWDKHSPTGWAGARATAPGEDFAWVRSKKERDALQFMQEAARKFNAAYGARYGVTVELGSDYTGG